MKGIGFWMVKNYILLHHGKAVVLDIPLLKKGHKILPDFGNGICDVFSTVPTTLRIETGFQNKRRWQWIIYLPLRSGRPLYR